MVRTVLPEILDALPAEHPEAVRSRLDLCRINRLMGNERWVLNQLSKHFDKHSSPSTSLVEIGAGNGDLVSQISQNQPGGFREVYGVDLVAKPDLVPAEVDWVSGDLFALESEPSHPAVMADVVVANLFLHHFSEKEIASLIRIFSQAQLWVINEPYRSGSALFLSKLMGPFVNEVTAYDMDLSIRAGFRRGEMQAYFSPSEWAVEESVDVRGAIRWVCKKRG